VYFNYNTAGFGSNVVANGHITITPLDLMNSFYFVVNTADNTSSKVAVITEATNEMLYPDATHPVQDYFNAMPITFTPLFRVTMDVASNTATAGIDFDAALMNGGQYYQSTTNTDPFKYVDPNIYNNNLSTFTLSTLYGAITYGTTITPIHDCSLTLKDGATVIGTANSDVNGNYNFSGIADGTYTIETACSLTRGGTTSQDLFLLRDYLTFVSSLNPLQQLAADLNWDGAGTANVTSQDLFIMRDFLTFVISSWTAPDWVFMVQSVNVSSGTGTANYSGLCSGDLNGDYSGF
jgi:hypothetical protein